MGNRIFITQALEKEQRLTVMCFDRAEGKRLWQSGASMLERTNAQDQPLWRVFAGYGW
jgi:hypothetical protein